MSNIHGLGDYRNNNNYNAGRGYMNPAGGYGDDQRQLEQMQNFVQIQDQLPLIGGQSQSNVPPRKETFWDMLKQACCPSFKIASFIFYVTIIDVIVYIITLIIGWSNTKGFLAPKWQTLIDWGAKDSDLMKQGQVYRFITAMFLHASFFHILVRVFKVLLLLQLNSTAQIIIGFQVERIAGPLQTMIIYLIAGIGGNLLSALASDSKSVGASGAIYGLVGSIASYYIMNWKTLDVIGSMMKCCLCCMFFMFLFFMILFAFPISNVDYLGHLGGFFTGLFISFCFLPVLKLPRRRNTEDQLNYVKVWRIIGGITTFVWFALGFSLFYTVLKV